MINHDLYQPPDTPKPYEYFLAMIEQLEEHVVWVKIEIARVEALKGKMSTPTTEHYIDYYIARDTRILKQTRCKIGAYKTHLRRTENLARRTEEKLRQDFYSFSIEDKI